MSVWVPIIGFVLCMAAPFVAVQIAPDHPCFIRRFTLISWGIGLGLIFSPLFNL